MENDLDQSRNHNQQLKQDPNIINPGNDNHSFIDLTTLPSFILHWIEQNSTNIIVIWDVEGKIVFTSKAIENLLDFKSSELCGTMWYDRISSNDVIYLESHFDNYTNTTQIFNINILNKHGKYIWCECAAAKIQEEEGKSYFISILRDISDKKEAEEMMIRSEKMSIAGQLAAGIAHEIRNPLTSLKGFLQLLKAGVDRKEEYYKIMIDEIEKMEAITSELLFISKPLTDNKKNEPIEKMIEDVVVLLNPQAELQGSNIKWESQKGSVAYCDRSQIKQVLINLVKNAFEAMDSGGTIEIKVRSTETQSIIDVIDEGPGVPEEIIHKLGEPFFTTKQHGTGLGLMITNQILERHDGKMEIQQNKEKGSTFRITLPRQAE